MKRDMRLIVKILRHIRDSATPVAFADVPDFEPEYTAIQTTYHIELCTEAGFLKRNNIGLYGEPGALRLTWQGHEKLEACSDC